MIKIFLSITTLLFLVIFVNAQNSSPYWSLAGNSNATSSSKLGTTNAINLRLFTNNVERMRINTSGNVGIGTTNAASRLTVNGTGTVSPFKAQVNGVTKLYVDPTGGVSIGKFATPPANGLYVSGNVGIGTTSSTAKLNVYNKSPNGSGVYNGIYSYGSSTGVSGTGGKYGFLGYSEYGAGGHFESYGWSGLIASTTNGYYAAQFVGNIQVTGTVYQSSDKNLKKNIQEFENAMSTINKLKPKYYQFRDDGKYKSLNLPKGNHYGLLAQELEEVLPNLVLETPHELRTIKPITAIKPNAEGTPSPELSGQQETKETINIKVVNYDELIPIVIKGIQEQDGKIKEQDARIKEQAIKLKEQLKVNEDLQNQIKELKTLIQSITKQGGNITLKSSALLKQNIPNPSNNNTLISYYTPDDTRNAEILVSDMKGRVLKTFTLSKGQGQINIRSGELSSGTYNYTLYVNRSKIDTKQMIITR